MKRWWAVFYLGAGGILMFVYLTWVIDGWSSRDLGVLYYWPLISVLLCGLAIIRLCFYFLKYGKKRVWHLSLSDLLLSSFLVSALFAIFHATQRKDVFVRVCVPGSIFGGAFLIAALLVANRMGTKTATAKYGYAFGFLLKTFGLLALGATVSTLITILVINSSIHPCFRFCRDLLLGPRYYIDTLYHPLRVGIAVLPIGYLFCWCASRTPAHPASQSPQSEPSTFNDQRS